MSEVAFKRKSKSTIEFGDFQTPVSLARKICELLAGRQLNPLSILEPTCGTGNLLIASLDQFPEVEKAVGLDVNSDYVAAAASAAQARSYAGTVRIIHDDFFRADWPSILKDLPEPILVTGNPPWVTNAELGGLGSSNLPQKTNFQKHNGLDALTGKSNFDICESMLMRILELLDGRNATMAMLCKTAVARKVLLYAWRKGIGLKGSDIYNIDAPRHFGASVDACLLVCYSSVSDRNQLCSIYDDVSQLHPLRRIGCCDGQLVADLLLYDRWKHLQGQDETYRWRSGVKHDCVKIMELFKVASSYRNGLGESVELEDECVFPLLKSSDLVNGSTRQPRRWMLVTQKAVGDETSSMKHWAPKTWKYLMQHSQFLDARASSIYRKRPRFSIFGVGPYSFAPWKVAISGFYKQLDFKVIGSTAGKPIMLDDTSYFIACRTKREAEYIASILNSSTAKEFFGAFVFWDTKRPITVELLRRLDLLALARELGTEETMGEYVSQSGRYGGQRSFSFGAQGRLFSDVGHKHG